MSIQPYTVASFSPIAIYPAGLQGPVVVNNNGLNTVYLGDTADRNRGWPLHAGNAMQWHANTPLYAAVDTGLPTTLLVLDSGDVLPFAQVGISGAVAVKSDTVLLASLTFGTLFTPVLDVRTFNSVVILTAIEDAALTCRPLYITWFADSAGLIPLGAPQQCDVLGEAFIPTAQIVVQVKGPYLRVTLSGAAPVDHQIRVYGSYGVLNETYYHSGTSGDNAATYQAGFRPSPIIPGVSVLWCPGQFAGKAIVSVTAQAATNTGLGMLFQLQRVIDGVILFNLTVFSALAVFSVNFDIVIPKTPLVLVINNQTAINQSPILGLLMEGK